MAWQVTPCIIWLIVAAVILVTSALYVWSRRPLDLTPLTAAMSSLILTWILPRLRVGDIAPVARAAVVESMSDGVIVLDEQNRIVDLNRVAQQIIGYGAGETIGQPVERIWPGCPDLIKRAYDGTVMGEEVMLEHPDALRAYDVRLSPIVDWRGRVVSRVVVLHDITERKRVEKALRQRTAQLEALRGMGLGLTAQLDLDTLLHSIVSRAVELLEGSAGGLYLYQPERDLLEWVVSIGSNLAPIGTTLHRGKGFSGKIWETGEPLIVDDYQQWEERTPVWEGYPVLAIVGVPIRWGEEFLGVLNVHADPPRTFSATDAELLSLFATRAAIAIRNARLYEQAQHRLKSLTNLNLASQALISSLDVGEVLEQIVNLAGSVVNSDYTSVVLLDEEGKPVLHTEDFRGVLSISQRIRSNGVTRQVLENGQPIVVDMISDAGVMQPPIHRPDGELVRVNPAIVAAGIRSFAAAPIKIKGRTRGVLFTHSRAPYTFRGQLSLLTTFANQAAAAIENAQLYRRLLDYAEQLEQRVQERTAQLAAQYARLEAILDSVTDGIVSTDAEGEILQANPVAYAWLTHSLPPEDEGQLRETVRDLARRAEERPEAVLELTGLDLELKAAPILESAVEETLRLDFDELDGAVRSEPVAVVVLHDVSELKSLDRMKSNFVRNISHELRTPITTIKLYAHLMRQTSPEDEEWSEYLDALVWEADSQVQLGEEILQISRIYAGRVEMERYPTSLNELTEAAVVRYRRLAHAGGLTLEYRPAESDPVASVNRGQMMQVLSHILGDAIHYTPEGGKVTVSVGEAEVEGRIWATVAVSDTGEGIPEEDLPRIFERFFREEEPLSQRVIGTGLRLMIVKEIVELHGGQVAVESELGVGTTFIVRLPLYDNPSVSNLSRVGFPSTSQPRSL